MAEVEEVKKGRDRLMERYQAKYPDKTWDDEEALFGQINDDYDSYDSELAASKERDQKIANLFSSDPRSASFLMDWRDGGDPVVLMIQKYGDDFKAALEDPEKVEAIAAANKEFADKVAKEREYEEQYHQNMAETTATIERLQAEEGLTDDQIDEAITFLVGVMRDAILGKFSAESIKMALKAINHDADVELAEETGEVRGRNAKIEEKLRTGRRSDGTANLNGRNGGGAPVASRPELGVIDRYSGNMDIWQRGGEKRSSNR